MTVLGSSPCSMLLSLQSKGLCCLSWSARVRLPWTALTSGSLQDCWLHEWAQLPPAPAAGVSLRWRADRWQADPVADARQSCQVSMQAAWHHSHCCCWSLLGISDLSVWSYSKCLCPAGPLSREAEHAVDVRGPHHLLGVVAGKPRGGFLRRCTPVHATMCAWFLVPESSPADKPMSADIALCRSCPLLLIRQA